MSTPSESLLDSEITEHLLPMLPVLTPELPFLLGNSTGRATCAALLPDEPPELKPGSLLVGEVGEITDIKPALAGRPGLESGPNLRVGQLLVSFPSVTSCFRVSRACVN